MFSNQNYMVKAVNPTLMQEIKQSQKNRAVQRGLKPEHELPVVSVNISPAHKKDEFSNNPATGSMTTFCDRNTTLQSQ